MNFEVVVKQKSNEKYQIIEFIQTTSLTFWRYSGESQVYPTGMLIDPHTDRLANFLTCMGWWFIAHCKNESE